MFLSLATKNPTERSSPRIVSPAPSTPNGFCLGPSSVHSRDVRAWPIIVSPAAAGSRVAKALGFAGCVAGRRAGGPTLSHGSGRGIDATRPPRSRTASTTPASSIAASRPGTQDRSRSPQRPGGHHRRTPAESGSRVGPLHQRFGLAPPPLTGPSPPGRATPRPGRHPFNCRCRPRGHCRDHGRVPGRWPCAPRCRSAVSPPSANAATVRPPPAPSSPLSARTLSDGAVFGLFDGDRLPGAGVARPSTRQAASRLLRCATALRVTRRPPRDRVLPWP